MNRIRLAVLVLLSALPARGQFSWMLDTSDGARVIVETNVTCDGKPDFRFTISVGMPLRIERELQVAGATWYVAYPAHRPNSECLVYGPSTAIWHKRDPGAFGLEAVKHVLARRNATFSDFAEVENLLTVLHLDWRSETTRNKLSGEPLFRWLQMVQRMVSVSGFYQLSEQPLVRAWLLSHEDVLDYFAPDTQWSVRPSYFWGLYEANKTQTWAEEYIWNMATQPVVHDECPQECVLRAYVLFRPAQYWKRYPNGPHILEALGRARKDLEMASGIGCEGPEIVKAINEIRASLTAVTRPEKQELLKTLAGIADGCPK